MLAASLRLGLYAVISVSERTWKLVAGRPPKFTLWTPMNPFPLIVTSVPPVIGPKDGLMLVIAGGPATSATRLVMFGEPRPTCEKSLPAPIMLEAEWKALLFKL